MIVAMRRDTWVAVLKGFGMLTADAQVILSVPVPGVGPVPLATKPNEMANVTFQVGRMMQSWCIYYLAGV